MSRWGIVSTWPVNVAGFAGVVAGRNPCGGVLPVDIVGCILRLQEVEGSRSWHVQGFTLACMYRCGSCSWYAGIHFESLFAGLALAGKGGMRGWYLELIGQGKNILRYFINMASRNVAGCAQSVVTE
ncbi:unnamed protein product [Laminaria digitata]